MYFRRETVKVLPSGELANVQPYHVCTKGQEDRIIFRDEEDLRVAHNLLPICAWRANVIIIVDCVLNSHLHAGILASSLDDAQKFIISFKMSASRYLANRYGKDISKNVFNGVESRPIPLISNQYLRNAICYILNNAQDIGCNVVRYRWSSFRAMFCEGKIDPNVRKVSEMSYRERRKTFKTSVCPADPRWLITEDGVIEPASYCDLEYAEGAFDNDQKFFLKVLGLVDDQEMEQTLAITPNKMSSVAEIIRISEDFSRKLFSKPLETLTASQKIPVLKRVWRTTKTSVAQLARCFAMTKRDVRRALGLSAGAGEDSTG